jgi:hypothetical protein
MTMKTYFPQMTQAARLGERGVSIVSRIVNEDFSWLFKKIHQEHDYGIDGYVDVITQDGSVTGQMLAMQIKCGKSFFQEKNWTGYVYRGELKHFNYLANQPVPVIIAICHPDTEDCYWVRFDPECCKRTESGWQIVIPFGNKLLESRNELLAILPAARNSLSELEEVTEFIKSVNQTSFIHFVIARQEVLAMDVSRPRSFFDSLRRTKKLAMAVQGKVELSFLGYENDSRELYELDEIRRYIMLLDPVLSELFFFARTQSPTFTLKLFALCQTQIIEKSPADDGKVKIEYSTEPVGAFLTRHFLCLNQMTEWLGMSEDENKSISFAIAKCLKFDFTDYEKGSHNKLMGIIGDVLK